MSSFLVSKKGLEILTDGVYNAVRHNHICGKRVNYEGLNNYFKPSHKNIFKELNYLNALALYERYGDEIDENMYDDNKDINEHPEYTIESFLKMLDCYTYQCCEGEAEDSELYKIMNTLSDIIGATYVDRNSKLYEEASWG